jgi:purine-binding chemotaxis protein CheW
MVDLSTGSSSGLIDLLEVEIADQRCGLWAADVIEIVRAVTIVRFPKAPPIVEGLVNIRGRAVPVMDVRWRLRLPPKPVMPSDHLVLTRGAERVVAWRVDRACDVVRLPPIDFEEVRRLAPGAAYVAGVVKLPDGLMLIYDVPTFLSQTETDALAALELELEEAPKP